MSLMILGTSHIARQSVNEIAAAFESFKPDIVALELDRDRLISLLKGKRQSPRLKDVFKIGIKGFLFLSIGAWAEKKLGDAVGMRPGADMLAAVELAKGSKIKIALIDQHISITLRKLSKSISWKEKWNFAVDLFKGVVLRKPEVVFDLNTVPDEEMIGQMMNKVQTRYPHVYQVLVSDRNEYMANRLSHLKNSHPGSRILAVVGAGHKEEMIRLIGDRSPFSYSFTVSN